MNIESFKAKLEEEKQKLEGELENISHRDPQQPDNWEADPPEKGAAEFRDDLAGRFEEFDERVSTTGTLEKRLLEVNDALARITAGTYGICEIGGEPIEEDRLEANPAARTCKAHLDTTAEIQ